MTIIIGSTGNTLAQWLTSLAAIVSASGPLDFLSSNTDVLGAYSPRALRGGYTGKLFAAYRDSDGTTQDIYADKTGEPDWLAMVKFFFGTTGRIERYYSQYGGADLPAATAANGDIIYENGAFITQNGHLVAKSASTATQYITAQFTAYTGTDYWCAGSFSLTSTNGDTPLSLTLAANGAHNATTRVQPFRDGGAPIITVYRNSASHASVALANNTFAQFQSYGDATNVYMTKDGATVASAAVGGSLNIDRIICNGYTSGGAYQGGTGSLRGDMIVMKSIPSSGDRALCRAAMQSYWGV